MISYWALRHLGKKTTVRRPADPTFRRFHEKWQLVARRYSRPISTVVLDDEQKIKVLSDMNEYLHPATPRWYATRGIPLRRGYLFYGPPGTGKTSLSFALAGVFGLDIFVISLVDPSLTEEDLQALFTALPPRCVVLLEDIDSAGLTREMILPQRTTKTPTSATTTRTRTAPKVEDIPSGYQGRQPSQHLCTLPAVEGCHRSVDRSPSSPADTGRSVSLQLCAR